MILKNGKVFKSKFVGTGPSSYKKIIYWAAVSQKLRNITLRSSGHRYFRDLHVISTCIFLTSLDPLKPDLWLTTCWEQLCCWALLSKCLPRLTPKGRNISSFENTAFSFQSGPPEHSPEIM